MLTMPNVLTALLLATGITVAVVSWVKGIHEIMNHKAAHHHIVMMNEEVARRYREHQLSLVNK